MRAFTLVPLLFGLQLTACSGTGGMSGGSKAEKDEDADLANDEDTKASQPEMVSGAFLTCGPADDGPQDGGQDTFGCAAIDATKKTKRADAANAQVRVKTGSHGILKPASTAADSSSPWSFHYQIDKAVTSDVTRVAVDLELDGKPAAFKNVAFDASAADLAATGGAPVTIFLSSKRFKSGDSDEQSFDSVGTADKRCADLAAAAKRPETAWKALLSSETEHARNRITVAGPVKGTDGTQIAPGPVGFWGPHTVGIVHDEYGTEVKDNFTLWTGTDSKGQTKGSTTCKGWSSAGILNDPGSVSKVSEITIKATVGTANQPGKWLDDGEEPCGLQALGLGDPARRLYCVSGPGAAAITGSKTSLRD